MRRIFAALFAVAALAFVGPTLALAQATSSFSPTALPAALSVSTASSRVVFPSPGPTALIVNTGSNNAYLAFGSVTVTATTSGFLLGPGCSTAYSIAGQTYIAAITSSSTTALTITTGAGIPTLPPSSCYVTVPGSVVISGSVTINPGPRTIVPLDVATVTTGGTAVTALAAGHRSAGGFLYNPIGATINLCINEQGTASGTTSAGALTCVQPGQVYTLTPSAAAVSVITSDSAHPFSGEGLN